MFVPLLLITCAIHANAYDKNGIRSKEYVLDTGGLHKASAERRIFDFKKGGVKVDVKVVPSLGDDSTTRNKDDDDYFPDFPVKDIGVCIIEFSLGCIRKRLVRYLETVNSLDEITLLGQDIKLVKSRAIFRSGGRSMNDTDLSIERSVNDFFDSYTLRITLPKWNSKRERNQIDVMMDDTAVAEGRGKKGGGGGDKGGKKGGGGCKMMMMCMMMAVKMKIVGMMAMKGMIMGGMSLMVSMMMLMQKFGKGGGGGGGGPWQGGGGGDLKEIVLLTKASGGGGGGSVPSDSYGAPPASSYGPPSGGGGGYPSSGGGGWGRSFHKQMTYDKAIKETDAPSNAPMIGEATWNTDSIDYPDYQDYQETQISDTRFATANWNGTNHATEDRNARLNFGSLKNDSQMESPMPANAMGRSFDYKIPLINTIKVIEKNSDLTTSTKQPDIIYNENMTYTDEWQATAEKVHSDNVLSSPSSNARTESQQQIEPRFRDVPLIRGMF